MHFKDVAIQIWQKTNKILYDVTFCNWMLDILAVIFRSTRKAFAFLTHFQEIEYYFSISDLFLTLHLY